MYPLLCSVVRMRMSGTLTLSNNRSKVQGVMVSFFFVSQGIHFLPDDVARHPDKRPGRLVGNKRKSTSSSSTTDEGKLNTLQ